MELVDITGYEGLYKINKEGQVWGVKRQKFLKPCIDRCGYYRVKLFNNGKSIYFAVHRLLCLQFLPNPNNLPVVDHIDRNRSNNNLDNLRWVSIRGNNHNKTYQNKTGHKNIYPHYPGFLVCIHLEKKTNQKYFKTIEESISYRDNFYRENNLHFLV